MDFPIVFPWIFQANPNKKATSSDLAGENPWISYYFLSDFPICSRIFPCFSHLVGGLEPWNFMTFHVVGNFIIPTDEVLFFRGVGLNHHYQPLTRRSPQESNGSQIAISTEFSPDTGALKFWRFMGVSWGFNGDLIVALCGMNGVKTPVLMGFKSVEWGFMVINGVQWWWSLMGFNRHTGSVLSLPYVQTNAHNQDE